MKSDVNPHRVFWPIVLTWVGIDYLTKRWAETLPNYVALPVLGDWLRWRKAFNPGAAFSLSLGQHSRWIFMAFAVVAIILITWKARSPGWREWLRQVAAALVVGGATGNLIDRFRSPRGVVDFIDVGIGAYRWPTFNIADIGVTCGAIGLILSFRREEIRQAKAKAAAAEKTASSF